MKAVRKMNVRLVAVICCTLLLILTSCNHDAGETYEPRKVLIYHKTLGYHHESIETGSEILNRLFTSKGYPVVITEDAGYFQEDSLQQFAAVVFLNTTGDVLDHRQQADFIRYIEAGGGYIGIHAAADTEYDWPWYNGLVGAYFNGHPGNPNVRTALVKKTEAKFEATDSLADEFRRTDEWYNYRDIDSTIVPLLTLDESSYEGGTMKGKHPITWYHEYDGGKAFYTGFGHTTETYSEPVFKSMISKALDYVAADKLHYDKVSMLRVPADDRFQKVVLDFNLNEPTEMQVLKDGRVLFVERKGDIKLYRPDQDSTYIIGHLPVFTDFEYGLMGMALDPDYENNHYVYLYYSPDIEDKVQYLSRFEMDGNRFLPETERVMLKVPVQRVSCCHTGGSVEFGPKGNLFLSTGDDSNPFESSGYDPIDERPGRKPWDAQKSAGNTNDLRGKILRIHPEKDGSYTIPKGNLFPVGMEKTRPEIYVMGCRNPYRIHIDQHTGYLYWGDVGPDARDDDSLRGPRGHDEINQAREAGYFGWPYFVADNKPYREYDFATGKSGPYFDPDAPVNNSPNNTGLEHLPPAHPAYIWYPYNSSIEFPLVQSGGRNAMAGPIFYKDDYPASEKRFPAYYDGKFLTFDWIRNWVMAVTFKENGDLLSMEPLFGPIHFDNIIDMEFSPQGELYTLEYGRGWFTQNMDARLSRIEYNSGNRPPVIALEHGQVMGKTPLTVTMNAAGTYDPDKDKVSLTWYLGRDKIGEGDSLTYTFKRDGYYFVNLVASDGKDISRSSVIVRPGNEPPKVTIHISGNRSFYWKGRNIDYTVEVSDLEDGSTKDGSIPADEVRVTKDFLEQGYDLTEVAQGHQLPSPVTLGKNLVEGLDCMACHKISESSVGPSYSAVAQRYKDDPGAQNFLAGKVINGGSGNWGEQAMSAHPDLKPEDASLIITYILSLADAPAGENQSDLKGQFSTDRHRPDNYNGLYILTASYTDHGNEYGGLESSDQLILRNPRIEAESYSEAYHVNGYRDVEENEWVSDFRNGSYIGFDPLDLTGISSVKLAVRLPDNAPGGTVVELHQGKPDGRIIGKAVLDSGDQAFVTLPVDTGQGEERVYIVTKNANTDSNQSLLQLNWLEFQQ